MTEPFNFNKLDRPGRPTNKQLCDDFRKLLTEQFFIFGEPTAEIAMLDSEAQREEVLRLTKAWRNELWKKFREIETRLCPKPEDFRK